MAKLHTPGTYPAKIIDYGIHKTDKGPQAAILFEYKLPTGGTDRITWYGSFNGGAREYTIDAVIRCGFKGKNGAELNKGKGSGALDEVTEFEIVLDNETWQEKTRSKVKFINIPGGNAFRQKMADGEASVLMGGLNLEADFMEGRNRVGATKAASAASGQPPMPTQQPNFTESDVPW